MHFGEISYYVEKNNELSQDRDAWLAFVKPEMSLRISYRVDNFKYTFSKKEQCQLLGTISKKGRENCSF
jgi:hypothetical protein